MPRTEKKIQYAKEYYEKNKLILLEKSRKYYEENRDVIALKRQRAYDAKIINQLKIPKTIEEMKQINQS